MTLSTAVTSSGDSSGVVIHGVGALHDKVDRGCACEAAGAVASRTTRKSNSKASSSAPHQSLSPKPEPTQCASVVPIPVVLDGWDLVDVKLEIHLLPSISSRHQRGTPTS